MAVEDDQTNWRTVFCGDPSLLNVTSYPNDGTEHTVVQPDPAKLLVTTSPGAGSEQVVIQEVPENLTVKTFPDASTPAPVAQQSGVSGIWPAPNSLRVQGNGVQSTSGTQIIYTVPANKKLYIYHAQTTIRTDADADVNGKMGVRDETDTFQYYVSFMYMIIKGQISIAQSFSPALEADAAWDVYLNTTHAQVAIRGLILGWLEDA